MSALNRRHPGLADGLEAEGEDLPASLQTEPNPDLESEVNILIAGEPPRTLHPAEALHRACLLGLADD